MRRKGGLGAIKAPVFVYASREDHIVPWTAAYGSVALFKGKRKYVLGASGHIAGVINPPAKGKRNFWLNDKLPPTAQSGWPAPPNTRAVGGPPGRTGSSPKGASW
jgi:polyhydroxyalkanoate synthase